MKMVWLSLLGRVIFGLYFVYSGINHFIKYQGLKEYASFKKIPIAGLAVIITGLVLLGGGVSILTGYWIQTGTYIISYLLNRSCFYCS